jgi:hypothetical protein
MAADGSGWNPSTPVGLGDRFLAQRDAGMRRPIPPVLAKGSMWWEVPPRRAANSGYGREMLRLMAEMGNGPMHIGVAVTLEGGADFDNVVTVYYPGVEYFAEMLLSEFFTRIVGGKQLGDSQSSPPVPLLPRL